MHRNCFTWSGKIAQAYIGDDEFKHAFSLVISSVDFPLLKE